ncbi:MAG: energy transducer TonB [Saprospiraceae bacterium]
MKKSFLLLALSILTLFSIHAQNTFAVADNDAPNTVLRTADSEISALEMEENKFRKVENEVITKLQNEVEFPALAYEYGVEGTVLLQFTFDGEIKDLKVTKSIGAGCDKAAIKALENFPKLYKEMGGENVKTIRITIPFRFEI